jgi:urease
MKLAPREVEKLGLHNAGYLAQKRLARGLRLNYVEAVALIATQVPLILTFFFVFYYIMISR